MSGARRKFEYYYITVQAGDWDGKVSTIKANWSMESMHQYRMSNGELHVVFAWINPKQWAESRSAINGMLPTQLRFEITPLSPGFPWLDRSFYTKAVEILDTSSMFSKIEFINEIPEKKIEMKKFDDATNVYKRDRPDGDEGDRH